MVGADEAREKALVAAAEFDEAVLGPAHELESGWHFPMIGKKRLWTGVIVNKQTGSALALMANCSLDNDPTLYDRGYRFLTYDLVVHDVTDLEATVGVIHALHCVIREPYYKYDKVWRTGRALTEDEVRERLETLPAIFSCAPMYELEELEKAREAGWFTFEALEAGSW